MQRYYRQLGRDAEAKMSRERRLQLDACHDDQRGGPHSKQLRKLLDFYFEPFAVQNNRFLLDLILRKVRTSGLVMDNGF